MIFRDESKRTQKGPALRADPCIALYIDGKLFPFFLGVDEVDEDGEDEDDGDAVLGEDALDNLGEDGEHRLGLGKAQSDGQGQGHDGLVAGVHLDAAEHIETGQHDVTEHHDGAAAEHALGNSGEQGAESGENAGDNHHGGAEGDGDTVDNARHTDETHILAEGSDRGATEHTGNRTDETVAGEGTGDFLGGDIAVETDGGQGAGVTDGLGSGHEEDDHEGENGAEVEVQLERKHLGKGNKPDALEDGEVDHSHTDGQDVTDDETEEDGNHFPVALGAHTEKDTTEERHGTHNPVLGGAEVSGAEAAGERVGTDRKQGETDGDNHGRGDGRGDDFDPVLGEKTEQAFHDTADNDRGHHRAVAFGGGDADGDRQEGETDAHHDGEPGPHRLKDGEELDERTDTGDNHCVLDEVGLEGGVQVADAGQNHNGSDVRDEHRQHVLETDGECLPKRHFTVQGKGGIGVVFHNYCCE